MARGRKAKDKSREADGRSREADGRSREADEKGRSKKKRRPTHPRYSAAWFADWTRSIAVAVAIFLVCRTFLVAGFVITSGSMENTLLVGDFLLVNRIPLGSPVPFTNLRVPGYREPAHGDIIVFRADHSPGLDIVKRVVGLPGDTLWMAEGVLHRNGAALDEPYIIPPVYPKPVPKEDDDAEDEDGGEEEKKRGDARMLWHTRYLVPDPSRTKYEPTGDDWGPIIVPRERFFMMGDHRDDSYDSRYWGFAERRKLRGTPLFIYYSYDKEAPKPFRFVTAMRPGRIGPGPR